jgi:hypothetical protein
MSKWYAIAALEESLDRTKGLLFSPFRLVFWLKLALVVMLASGLGGGGNGSRIWDTVSKGGFDTELLVIAAVAFAIILFISLILAYVSAVFRFVYIKSLVKGDLRLIDDFKEHAGNGLKLFLFQVAFLVLFILAIVAGAVIVGLTFGFMRSSFIVLPLMIVGITAFIILVLILTLIMWLIMEFAVPLMYDRGYGIIEAINRLTRLIRSNFWQFIVYVFLKFSMGLVSFVLVFSISFVFFLIVFIILLIIGVGAYLGITALGELSVTPALLGLIVLGAIAYMVLVLVISYVVVLITLPLSVFLRYYGLVFLQHVEPALNLFKPEKRDKEESRADEDKVKVY